MLEPKRLEQVLSHAWLQNMGLKSDFLFSKDKEELAEESFICTLITQLAAGDKQRAILDMMGAARMSSNIQDFSAMLERETKISGQIANKIFWANVMLVIVTAALVLVTLLLVSKTH